MSDNPENPYESPRAEISSVKPLTAQGALTETMLFYLKGASPWLRFVGIAGFVMLGLYALLGITMIVGIQNITGVQIPGWSGVMGIGVGLVYSGSLAVLFFPMLFVFRFGRKIKQYIHTGNEADLEQALKNNKSLWQFIGVLFIISLGFTAMMVLFGGIAAIIAAVVSAV
ncbi:MAG: hypothetical protein LBI67_02630 [Treponema sp.]|jgi:hypothetical protein|nr:hypothetical protein [Treponema sp.]